VVVLVTVRDEVEKVRADGPLEAPEVEGLVLRILLPDQETRGGSAGAHVDDEDAAVLGDEIAGVDGEAGAVGGPLVAEDHVRCRALVRRASQLDPVDVGGGSTRRWVVLAARDVGPDDAEALAAVLLAGVGPADLVEARLLGQVVRDAPHSDLRQVALHEDDA
jgi:hypothetical protein